MSPITTVCAPAFVKAAQAVRPRGGVILAPAAVIARSLRGISTLKTPSFSFHLPFSPVSCSMRAVSNPFLAKAGTATSESATIVLIMVRLLFDLRAWIRGHLLGAFQPAVYLFPVHVLEECVHVLRRRSAVVKRIRVLVHGQNEQWLAERARLRVAPRPERAHVIALEVVREDGPPASAGETHSGQPEQLLPSAERPVRSPNRLLDRARWPAVSAQVPEVQLVQRGGIRESQLSLLQCGDDQRWGVLGDSRQLLLGPVQVAHRTAVIVLVMRDDEPLRQALQSGGLERERPNLVLACEHSGIRHR